jgi:hypothetical protein
VGKILGRLEFSPFNYLNPYLDPPQEASSELVADFYFYMVALDHRTSSQSGHFEGVLAGNFFHGADLLYALGIQKLSESEDFFTADRMATITNSDVIRWLCIEYKHDKVVIYKPEERAELLRDCGATLKRLGYRSAYELVKRSGNFLIRRDGKGLLQFLSNFKAYSDPVGKKSYLWVKFLSGRGLIAVKDPENLQVPVDNHLTRIALRTGIIEIEDEPTYTRLHNDDPFTMEEDIILRRVVRQTYFKLFKAANRNFREVDDFFWVLGRTHCLNIKDPLCEAFVHDPNCQLLVELKVDCAESCPLASCCKGSSNTGYRTFKQPNIRTYFY